MDFYKLLIRPLLFKLDPESAHELSISLARAARISGVKSLIESLTDASTSFGLESQLAGMNLVNPIGLAAGLDKGAEALDLFAALGFGHIEVGTVTPLPQPGNPKPRIFRIPQSRALINRMGFPSRGIDALKAELEGWRGRNPNTRCKIGINIGKNKSTPLEQAAKDYVKCIVELSKLADYFAINVSSPNTPELRKLQERERLSSLLAEVQSANEQTKPILLKIAPDLNELEMDDVIACCVAERLSGIIATNTTLSREGLEPNVDEVGGMSGEPLAGKSLKIIKHIRKNSPNSLSVIGVGGISSASQVEELLLLGISAVQVYTSLIYEGPFLVRSLKMGLKEIRNANLNG